MRHRESRSLADEVFEGIVLSENGKVADANEGFARMFGYEPDEVIGMELSAFLVAGERESAKRQIPAGSEEVSRYRGFRKDGTDFDVEVRPRQTVIDGREVRVSLVLGVGERTRAEEELRWQRDLYEGILAAQSELGEGFVIVEGQVISHANEAFTKMSGYSLGELQALPSFLEIVAEDERETLMERRRKRMESGEGETHYETVLGRKDGVRVPVEVAFTVLQVGGSMRFMVVARDITERKRVEEALGESEERYRVVIEQAAEGIILIDVDDYHILEANPEFRRLFGYTSEEVAGLTIYDLVAHDRETVDQNIERTLEEGNRIVGERRYRRRDGSLVDVMVSGNAISYGGRRTLSLLIRDITERKRAEEELQRSESSLRAAQRMARLGDWEYELEEDRGRWSNELFSVFGFSPQEFVPTYRTFFDLVHPGDRLAVRREVFGALRGGRESSIDYRIVRSDGEVRNVYTEYRVVRDESGRSVSMSGTIQDITGRKRIEEDLRRSNAELEQFAYVASHDLQEPLRMVSSYTQLLARRYKDQLDDDADEFIDYAVDGAERMQRLINDLLVYSRLGTRGKEFAPTDCDEVLEGVRDNLQVAIEESGVDLASGELPTVMGDRSQLLRLLQNLVENAIKFSGVEPPEIRVQAELSEDEWVFSVEDNGIGIAPEYADRIFVIFQRLHDRVQYPGTGIGLAVCKKIVERHGGRIWIESEVGEGSTFYFTLPALRR